VSIGGRLRGLLRPDTVVEQVTDLTPPLLLRLGLRGLLLDLDNTLVAHGSLEHDPKLPLWGADLQRAGVALFLLSNAKPLRVRIWSERLQCEGVALAGKPLPFAFLLSLKRLRLPARQCGIAGDQLFTDILGGNMIGCHTFLVKAISERAPAHTRLARSLERRILGDLWPRRPS
jgi:HAD superfamily phosphatase (TIGR01668 family)